MGSDNPGWVAGNEETGSVLWHEYGGKRSYAEACLDVEQQVNYQLGLLAASPEPPRHVMQMTAYTLNGWELRSDSLHVLTKTSPPCYRPRMTSDHYCDAKHGNTSKGLCGQSRVEASRMFLSESGNQASL